MLFYVEFGREVLDCCGVGVGFGGAAAVSGRVDEVFYAVGDGGIDEGFSLCFFNVRFEWDLHAENAVEGVWRFAEDGGSIVEVAFEKADVGVFGEGEGFG